jgi:2-polyprenyl-6-methoxyphenol hydroxylase-like FAD-dependent oxidoreductase
MKQDMYDVAQVGYGPVGQVFAGLMGQFGYRAAVFEQWPDRYAKPRAGHVDHEAMRILQSLGVAEAIADRAWPMTGYDLIDPRGETLLALDWNHEGISGWHSDYLFYARCAHARTSISTGGGRRSRSAGTQIT